MREYDLIADWYWTDRGRTVGVTEALALAATLRAGSRILDLGCGNGVPITEALVKADCRVTGLDSSIGMLMHFRHTLSGTPAVRADARQCPFLNGGFDAAISWGMMFHLPPSDQATVLASVSRVLKLGSPFLFTGAEIEDAERIPVQEAQTVDVEAEARRCGGGIRHGGSIIGSFDSPDLALWTGAARI